MYMKFNVFFVLTVFILGFNFTACKKNKDYDNPNIEYKYVNKTISTTTTGVIAVDSVDVFGDHSSVLFLMAQITPTADTSISYIVTRGAGLFIDSSQHYGTTVFYKIKNLFKFEQTPLYNSLLKNWGFYGIAAVKSTAVTKGYAGVGDVYIPILLIKPSQPYEFYYGWIRINISTDCRTFKFIDFAYQKLPDIPIKMGVR